jgi:hypothetical protein
MLHSAAAPSSPGLRPAEDFFSASRVTTMKQVFLIQAHRDLTQLNALVEQLRDDDFIVYVNLDRKCDLDPAQVDPAARQVRRRVDVHWGTFSQVQAVLHSLAQIVAEVPAFDKVLFLSAQDFPLLSNARLKTALAALRGRELLDTVPIGTEEGQWAAGFRYQYFHPGAGGTLHRLACSAANRLMRAGRLRRRLPGGMRPFGGSSWWTLSRECICAVLDRIEREPGILRFFRRVDCPDEMFFQTLVMNSAFAGRVLAQNFRYIQWPENGARNPEVLDEDDFAHIAASTAHFCRKIDSRASAALVPRLLALRAG